MSEPIDPVFFPTPEDLRGWLQAHGDTLDAAWIGLFKKASGRPSVTWPQLVDQLLCFGWIDGLRKSWDDDSYVIRVTPRRPGSNWSSRNRERASALLEAGLMEPAGLRAWKARRPKNETSVGEGDPESLGAQDVETVY